MDSFSKLVEFFKQFPGTGPRQARRFVYFLLSKEKNLIEEMAKEIINLKNAITQCTECFLYFPKRNGNLCETCSSPATDRSVLLIVEKDTDQEIVKKNGGYKGLYFILGGLLPILEKNPAEKIRIRELLSRVETLKKDGLKEIIVALSANPEGENTFQYVKKTLEPLAKGIRITALGRGLSTGAELEYSDSDTISHALKNRS